MIRCDVRQGRNYLVLNAEMQSHLAGSGDASTTEALISPRAQSQGFSVRALGCQSVAFYLSEAFHLRSGDARSGETSDRVF